MHQQIQLNEAQKIVRSTSFTSFDTFERRRNHTIVPYREVGSRQVKWDDASWRSIHFAMLDADIVRWIRAKQLCRGGCKGSTCQQNCAFNFFLQPSGLAAYTMTKMLMGER
jgi:hypothetical protein